MQRGPDTSSIELENQEVPQQQNYQGEVLAAVGQLAGMIGTIIQQTHNVPTPTPAIHTQGAIPEAQVPPATQIPPDHIRPPSPRPYRSTLPDFIKCNRYFDGAFGKPDEAEDWLAQIERSFRAFEIPHHLRLAYGTYMLTFNARVWWESKSRELLPPITWETFKHEFLENFFPGSLRVQYSADFLHITQGGQSLEQYETEFSRLLQYAPESYKHSEELKRQVFLNGLDEDLRVSLEEFDIRSFRELVERARIVENTRKRKREMLEKEIITLQRKSLDDTNLSYEFKVPKHSSIVDEKNKLTKEDVQCWKCKGRHYPKQCPRLQSKCYLCGNPNHTIQNCPKKTSTTCFICTKTGHLANKCPGRQNPHVKSPHRSNRKRSSNKNKSNNRNENENRSRTPQQGICLYNMQGQWVCGKANDKELEYAAMEEDDNRDYGLVTG